MTRLGRPAAWHVPQMITITLFSLLLKQPFTTNVDCRSYRFLVVVVGVVRLSFITDIVQPRTTTATTAATIATRKSDTPAAAPPPPPPPRAPATAPRATTATAIATSTTTATATRAPAAAITVTACGNNSFPPGGFFTFSAQSHDIPMNPGLEPVLLDPEKPFLLPGEINSGSYHEKLKLKNSKSIFVAFSIAS